MAATKKSQTKKRTKATPIASAKRSVSRTSTGNSIAAAELAESNLRLTVLVAIFAGLSIVFAAMAFKTYV